jgi:hypothetical protein
MFEQAGVHARTARPLNSYAAEIAATGDPTQALALHHQALDLARQAHQPEHEAGALEGIGVCHTHLGGTEAGATHLNKALEIYQRMSMTPDTHRAPTRLEHTEA